MMSPMTTKIYACVVHDKRTLSLLKVFFHRFSGGREKKRVFVNVFHTNKVFRLDARPENDKTKRSFLCCVKKKDAKKRERDSLFPSSSTFYGLVQSHVSDRSVSLSMDPHSRKKPLPFPPPNKKKKKQKNTKNWTVLVKQHQDENVRWKRRLKTKKHFFVVFIYRKKKRKTTLTDETRPIPISLSNNNNY